MVGFALKEACFRFGACLETAKYTRRTAVARQLVWNVRGHFLTLLSVLGNAIRVSVA